VPTGGVRMIASTAGVWLSIAIAIGGMATCLGTLFVAAFVALRHPRKPRTKSSGENEFDGRHWG
jgi:hypothetical protein